MHTTNSALLLTAPRDRIVFQEKFVLPPLPLLSAIYLCWFSYTIIGWFNHFKNSSNFFCVVYLLHPQLVPSEVE